MAKALALHSGGLDSTLAIRVLQEQNVPVEAVHFVSVFDGGMASDDSAPASKRTAEQLGIAVHYVDFSDDILSIVKNPKHGYGRNMNPCIDCHARMIQRAAAMTGRIGADFLVTGEVLGERPMSQRRDALSTVEREAGVPGLLLRPLCAKLLEPTVPELKGWVDREKLYGISGRCRRPQLELARKLGIVQFPTPAGGCLLTDPGFAGRMWDLLRNTPDGSVEDVRLLKVGRHFRLGPGVKLVVGRNQEENVRLEKLAREGDMLLDAMDAPGPLALLRGQANDEHLGVAASILVRYGKAACQPTARVKTWYAGKEPAQFREASPAAEDVLERLRIGPMGPKGGRRARE
jgi:hypothetical protein